MSLVCRLLATHHLIQGISMLTRCSNCNQSVGFFKLQDTLCISCRDQAKKPKGKISQIFGFSPFWGFAFVAGFVAHSALIAAKPSAEQIALSAGLMALAIASLVFSLIIRFLLLRRALHAALAIVLTFPFAGAFLAIVGIAHSSPASLTTLGFIFLPYYVLRLPNAWLQSDA